jgi:phosphohistidine phosphatase
MALYLVQHGRNLPKEQDSEQPLSDEGRAEVERIAEVAAGYRVHVAAIDHSPKLRAQQTAEIFGSYLKPEAGIKERSGIKALDDVTAVANELNPSGNRMLVGHLPFMERLAAFLITGRQEPRVIKFQNGGIVCLNQEEDAGWFIAWSLLPNIG